MYYKDVEDKVYKALKYEEGSLNKVKGAFEKLYNDCCSNPSKFDELGLTEHDFIVAIGCIEESISNRGKEIIEMHKEAIEKRFR